MDLLPAIDLRHGQVVRLRQGDDARATAYASDPLAVAAAFAAAGVRRIHVVDLDAALGEPPQRDLLTRLLGGRVVGIQLGGGLRDRAAVEWALAAGCERVVMASLPAREPGRFAALAREFPGRLLPAVEVAHGEPRVAGWTRAAGSGLDELCSRLRGLPCPAVLVTDVERDGMLCGPNFELACSVGDATGLPALLSGGVRTLADLATAAALPAIGGTILGRALYEGQIDLVAALAVCRRGAGAAVAAGGSPAPGSELPRSMP
jgi:phosphoribosylformimino-5-aminoimidazole carboxamide ribotide isomerase